MNVKVCTSRISSKMVLILMPVIQVVAVVDMMYQQLILLLEDMELPKEEIELA